MYIQIHNENYGYSVATFDDYVVVGNPGIVRYNNITSSTYWSGSVDVFKYNYKTDQHDYVGTLYKNIDTNENLLAAEISTSVPPPTPNSVVTSNLHTELSGSDIRTKDKDILIDAILYDTMVEDGYGKSLDINDDILIVGCPYFRKISSTYTGVTGELTGSCADLYDLSKYRLDYLNYTLVSSTIGDIAAGTGSMSGFLRVYATAPSGYDWAELLVSTNVAGPYTQVIAKNSISSNGGYVEFYVDSTAFPSAFFLFKFTVAAPYITTISNPDPPLTGSFGEAVSINDGWLAVGSPYVSGSEGMVYLYQKNPTSLSWSFQQKIIPNTDIKGLMFGAHLELNKVTSSMSGSLIVGIGNPSGSRAFLFEYISGSWTQTYIFSPYNPTGSLQFGRYYPYNETFTTASNYGTAVGMYNNTVVIGSSKDRTVKEYESSYTYEQGAVYVYEKCIDITPLYYQLVLKTYGDETTLKNNRLGFSVSVYGNNIIAGCPKTNVDCFTSCYIESTLEQLHYCAPDLENTLNGQAIFIQKNTSSLDWSISKVYQKKKRYLSPYRSFGYSVDIADKSMVIGAPMLLCDVGRQVNVTISESISQSIDYQWDDVAGKAYIYNLNDFKPQFHVGNVFYRNGSFILNTSGSIFDQLWFNPISQLTYEYDMDFQSEHTIYEKQVICSVNPGEFNVSTNPTAITRNMTIWDINKNGYFDFQDVDVILSYMQYKNTKFYGNNNISTDWSSSIVTTDDEKSLLNYYQESNDYTNTPVLISESIQRFEFVDTWMQNELDLNQDNRIDTNDLNIMWKYFSNRLTQNNYGSYITPSCTRKLFSDIIDHMDTTSGKINLPLIRSDFLDYDRLSSTDKTGSFLAPYTTTIGLYSGLDLVAVAKLGSPIKIIPELPINFVVKMDF